MQNLAPKAKVVKGFNVLSAYALESGGIQGSKEVRGANLVQKGQKQVSKFRFFSPEMTWKQKKPSQMSCVAAVSLQSIWDR